MSVPTTEPVLQHSDPQIEEEHLVCTWDEEAPADVPVLGYCGALTAGSGSDTVGGIDCATCERLQPVIEIDGAITHCTGEGFADEACLTCPQHLLRLLG